LTLIGLDYSYAPFVTLHAHVGACSCHACTLCVHLGACALSMLIRASALAWRALGAHGSARTSHHVVVFSVRSAQHVARRLAYRQTVPCHDWHVWSYQFIAYLKLISVRVTGTLMMLVKRCLMLPCVIHHAWSSRIFTAHFLSLHCFIQLRDRLYKTHSVVCILHVTLRRRRSNHVFYDCNV
jgi:hypothetical protein